MDYACRSVISPDPYLNVDEIGIPEVIKQLIVLNELFLNLAYQCTVLIFVSHEQKPKL